MIGIDIGNTRINFAWFDKRLRKTDSLAREKANAGTVAKILKHREPSETIILSSVVPGLNDLFIRNYPNSYLVGKDIEVPIKCFYDKKKVGSDRLLAAYAAKKAEPSVRLVLDFGTAITLDFLTAKGDYRGGIILPGIQSTLKTFQQCALLPNQIKIKKVKRIIPKNTCESVNKGLQEGFAAMINALIAKYRRRLRLPSYAVTVITGGDSTYLMPYLGFSFSYRKNLVLKGLFHLYREYGHTFS